MKKLTPKFLFTTLFLLFTTQASAQEETTSTATEQSEAGCPRFPKCDGVDGSAGNTSDEEKSQWSLLWEKLNKEMKEVVDSLPSPTQPE